jgi:uncharacterized membrane protein YqaE (UPF0057 family)
MNQLSNNDSTNKLLLILISLFVPPVAVFVKEGGSNQFIINLVLYLLCFTSPIAVIHAIYVILK